MVARLVASPPDPLAALHALHAEARASLPRALALGTLLVASLFAVVGASRPFWPRVDALPTFVVDIGDVFSPPPPVIAPPSNPGGGASPTRVASPNTVPNPVVDERAEEVVVEPARPGPSADDRTRGESGDVVGPLTVPRDLPGTGAGVPDPFEVHDFEPEPMFSPKPDYPELAFQAGVEGYVVLRVLVETDGRVSEIRTERSVPLLDEAARSAVARWTFSPARTNGHAVRAWVVVPVRFTLHDPH